MDRREFLHRRSGVGRSESAAAAARRREPRKADDRSPSSVVLGGASVTSIRTTPSPDAPDEYRGPFKTIATRLPGVRVCEHMPLQAGILDRLALLRGVRSVENDHFLGEVYTGLPRTAGKRSAFRSVVSRLTGHTSPPAAVRQP
jgi:hypothetical protein